MFTLDEQPDYKGYKSRVGQVAFCDTHKKNLIVKRGAGKKVKISPFIRPESPDSEG